MQGAWRFASLAARCWVASLQGATRASEWRRKAGRYNWPMPPQEQFVSGRLAALGIDYERHEHPPIATAEEGEVHWAGIEAVHCKNLFLRNQKGTRHYLVILAHTKRADLRAVADQIGDG